MMIVNETSDFCKQYQYLQLEKPSGVEVEIPVHKTMPTDLLKGGSYRTPPPGSDRVKRLRFSLLQVISFK